MDFDINTQEMVRHRFKGDIRKAQGEVVDDLPNHTSIKRRYGYDDYNNESIRFNVLKRMIDSLVGYHWNQVYSHILSKFSRIREGDRLAIDRLSYFVEQHCDERTINGKKVMFTTDGHRIFPGDYYVHPETGILLKMPGSRKSQWNREKPAKEIEYLKIGKVTYRKVDGIWYEVSLRKLPADERERVHDVCVFAEHKRLAKDEKRHPNSVIMPTLSRWDYFQRYGSYSYAVAKRQLNKRELRSIVYPRLLLVSKSVSLG